MLNLPGACACATVAQSKARTRATQSANALASNSPLNFILFPPAVRCLYGRSVPPASYQPRLGRKDLASSITPLRPQILPTFPYHVERAQKREFLASSCSGLPG